MKKTDNLKTACAAVKPAFLPRCPDLWVRQSPPFCSSPPLCRPPPGAPEAPASLALLCREGDGGSGGSVTPKATHTIQLSKLPNLSLLPQTQFSEQKFTLSCQLIPDTKITSYLSKEAFSLGLSRWACSHTVLHRVSGWNRSCIPRTTVVHAARPGLPIPQAAPAGKAHLLLCAASTRSVFYQITWFWEAPPTQKVLSTR